MCAAVNLRPFRIPGSRRVARVSEAFDTYWRLAFERQAILLRRLLETADPPWTYDPILARHRFTNAYRVADRVSQYLVNRVIPGSSDDERDLVFRVLLFKVFNRILLGLI